MPVRGSSGGLYYSDVLRKHVSWLMRVTRTRYCGHPVTAGFQAEEFRVTFGLSKYSLTKRPNKLTATRVQTRR